MSNREPYNLEDASLSTHKNRKWAVKGFINETQIIVPGCKTVIATFQVAGEEVQYALAIPKDSILGIKDVDEPAAEGEKWVYIQEEVVIFQQMVRPIHLGFIDTSVQALPAEISNRDLGQGITVLALPASSPAGLAIPAS